MATHSTRPCPSCASTQLSNLAAYSKDEWVIVQCVDCDLVFLENPVDYDALADEFAWETTFEKEDAPREKSRGVLKKLAKRVRIWNYNRRGNPQDYYETYLGRGGKLLDIGCADVVRFGAPFIPFGIEISKVLAKRGDAKMRKAGGRCVHGSGADGVWEFDENQFDCAMLHSYLEHETQPVKVIEGLFRVLKPGGKAFILVPNFNSLNRRISGKRWPGFRYPDHVTYFTSQTLRELVERAGFDYTLVNRANLWLDDNIKALIEKPMQREQRKAA